MWETHELLLRIYVALCGCFADLLHLVDISDGIHFLHVLRTNVIEAECGQPFTRKVGIVARVGEELRHARDTLPDHITHLAVNWIACKASAKDSAQEILLRQRRSHKRRGYGVSLTLLPP